ncbi:MAG TPA: hypothetical protein VGA05_06885 [Candidatus Bathyarchaeia archaeon]
MKALTRKTKRLLGQVLFISGLCTFLLMFILVQVMNSDYVIGNDQIKFQGYPSGPSQILSSSCILKASDWSPRTQNCTLFSYNDLLYLSALLSFAGIILRRYYES